MKKQGKVEVYCSFILDVGTRRGVQLHDPATLPPVPIGYEAGWAPKPVRTTRREKSCSCRESKPGRPTSSPVAIPTAMFSLNLYLTSRAPTQKLTRFYVYTVVVRNIWKNSGVAPSTFTVCLGITRTCLHMKSLNIMWAVLHTDSSIRTPMTICLLKGVTNKACKLVYLRRVQSSGIQRRVIRWKSTEVSEEHIASIFRIE
jgi:hypothetical protein